MRATTKLGSMLLGAGWLVTGTSACGLPALLDLGIGTASASCTDIAKEYATAWKEAVLCDPAAADACGAQRPIVTYEATSDADAKIEGLCDVANGGYVSPSRTAALDDILARYDAAGCSLGVCPGPAPYTPTCVDDGTEPPHCR